LGGYFLLRNTAVKMGADVLRLWRRGVVHIPADVEVEVVLAEFGDVHDAGEAWDVAVLLEGGDDLLGVLRLQIVLGAASGVLAVGVDEEDLGATLLGTSGAASQDEDAGRDAGAVEEVRGQADDRFKTVVLDDALADLLLLAAPEEDAVGHDRRAETVWHQDREHVLGEHQVRLLAGLGRETVLEALRVLHA